MSCVRSGWCTPWPGSPGPAQTPGDGDEAIRTRTAALVSGCFTLKGQTGSGYPVDVLGALDCNLRQSGDVELSTAVRVQLDVQFVCGILPEQVAAGNQSVRACRRSAGQQNPCREPSNLKQNQNLVQNQTQFGPHRSVSL